MTFCVRWRTDFPYANVYRDVHVAQASRQYDHNQDNIMKTSSLTVSLASAALFAALQASSAQAQIVVQPSVVVSVPGVVIATPFVVYAPNPSDVYIANVQRADVVYLNGDTFVWSIDGNGHRYQQFYAHGDHRADVFSRRDELHRVMARNGGRLPSHEAAPRDNHDQRREKGERPPENRDDHRN
jgi:hypothetical protein